MRAHLQRLGGRETECRCCAGGAGRQRGDGSVAGRAARAGGGHPIAQRVGGGEHAPTADACGVRVAAARLPAPLRRQRRRYLRGRGVHGGARRAARRRGGPPRRRSRVPGGEHGHGGSAAYVPEHGQPHRWPRRRDGIQQAALGPVGPRLDRRGEPPRRPPQPLPLPHRPRRHAPGGGHRPPPPPQRHANVGAHEPIPQRHLRRVPGARHLHLPRPHGAARGAARRPRAHQDLRRDRRRREAARGRVHHGERQAPRGGPGRHGARAGGRLARESHHAGAAHVRRPRRKKRGHPVRAVLRGGAARRRVHGERLRGPCGALRRPAVAGGGPRGALRRGPPRAGVRLRAGAQDPADGGAGAAEGGPRGARPDRVQLDLRQDRPRGMKLHAGRVVSVFVVRSKLSKRLTLLILLPTYRARIKATINDDYWYWVSWFRWSVFN